MALISGQCFKTIWLSTGFGAHNAIDGHAQQPIVVHGLALGVSNLMSAEADLGLLQQMECFRVGALEAVDYYHKALHLEC